MSVDIQELKNLILTAAEKDLPVDDLDPDEPLFGSDSRLSLDSIDALQISMAIQKRYAVRLNDSKETRRAMASLKALAAFIAQAE